MSDSELAGHPRPAPGVPATATATATSPTASSDAHVASDSPPLADADSPTRTDAPMNTLATTDSSASPHDDDERDEEQRDRDAVATDEPQLDSSPVVQPREASQENGTDEPEQEPDFLSAAAGDPDELDGAEQDQPEAVPNRSSDGPASATATTTGEPGTGFASVEQEEAVLTPIEEMLDIDLAGDPSEGTTASARGTDEAEPAPLRPELAALKSEWHRDRDDLVADTPIVKPAPAPAGSREGPDVEIGGDDDGAGRDDDLSDGLEPLPAAQVEVDDSAEATATMEAEAEAAPAGEEARPDAEAASTAESKQQEQEAENAPVQVPESSPPTTLAPGPESESLSRSESTAASTTTTTTTTASSTAPAASATTAATFSSQPEMVNDPAVAGDGGGRHHHETNRRESVASVTTVSAPGSAHLVSGILIVSSLESIAASKEAKKSKPLKDALDAALESLKSPHGAAAGAVVVDPHVVFLPLRLACETRSLPLMITALDCLGKLVSYDFFSEQQQQHDDSNSTAAAQRLHHLARVDDDNESVAGGGGGGGGGGTTPAAAANFDSLPLADQITSTVCDCFSPSPNSSSTSSSSSSASSAASATTTQHDTLLLRLLSCLLGLILSSTLPVHQSALLKAVRTVYNVFLLGRPGTVQTVAQATLGQIVGGVFGRISFGDLEHEAAAAAASLAVPPLTATTPAVAEAGKGSPSRSASRTDLASVAEEKEDGGFPPVAEGGSAEPHGGPAADNEAASEPAAAPATGTETETEPEPKSRPDEDDEVDATTPRVSVAEDAPRSDEAAGERITRCGA